MLDAHAVPMAGTHSLEGNPMDWADAAMPIKCINPIFDATNKEFLTTNANNKHQQNDSSSPQNTFPATAAAAVAGSAQLIDNVISEQASDHSSTEILEITSSPKPTLLKPLLPPTATAAPNAAAIASALAAPSRRPSPTSRLVDSSWPHAMVSTHFFGSCSSHAGQRKNELNFFCLGCGPTGGEGALMCQYCAQAHAHECDGACIQLYRYMYHDIVRVAAVNHLTDLSGIQQYRANSHPAVHLRPMGPPANKSPYSSMCDGGCGRCLDPQWDFCSLSCKLGLARADNATTYGTGNKNNFNNNNNAFVPGAVVAYVNTTNASSYSKGAFTKNGKRTTSAKHGSTNNLTFGTTASNSEAEDNLYYNEYARKWNTGGSYGGMSYAKRAALMVPRGSLKGAKRRKSVYPLRSDSL